MDEKNHVHQVEDIPRMPNHTHHYTGSESTVTSTQRTTYGHQDTFGETDANQVSVEGT